MSYGKRTDTESTDGTSVLARGEGPGGALVRQLRKELGTSHGTIQRIAGQIGCGVESLRTWVKQADIDEGVEPGVTTADAKRIKDLEQNNRELRRANAILRSASAFFAAELDRPLK